MKILSRQDAVDILYGCTVLGTGGGGSLAAGLKMIERDFDEGKTLRLADLDEIPDDGLVATPYGCGAPLFEDGEEDARYAALPRIKESSAVLAFKTLEEYMGKKFCAVSSTELGGENTAEALHIAMQLDLPLADSDPAGRSVPELQHSTYYVRGESITPMGIATNFGETVIIKNVVNDLRAEEIVRAIAVASGDEVGVADHPMCGKNFKHAVIRGAITYSLNVGRTLREANEAGRDAAAAIAEGFDGKVLFKGSIESTPWECRDGFNYGTINIKGGEAYSGEKYSISMQNENIYAHRNGELDICVPDLICMIDSGGMPVTNPNWQIGQEVSVIGLPSPEIWKTPEGAKVFSAKSFGLKFDYRPFK